jgi:Type IV secretion system pilin
MKQVLSVAATALTVAFVPVITFAAISDNTGGGEMQAFVGGILGFINTVLLPAILGLAFLMFVWGVFKFFILGGSDEEAQAKGKSLMIYAVAGFVLILSFYGIVNIVVNGLFGTPDTATDIKTPGVPTI